MGSVSFLVMRSSLFARGVGDHAASDVPAINLLIAIMELLVIIGYGRCTTQFNSSHYILSVEMQRAGISNQKPLFASIPGGTYSCRPL